MENQTGRNDLRCAVIGAGASGVLAMLKLKERGFTRIVAYEKADEIGGTWHYNRYPGVACDVPSQSYRFSFAPKADWTKAHAPGAEIQGYLRQVAEDNELLQFIRFGEEISSATWTGVEWVLKTKSGLEDSYDIVISAVGTLHQPQLPDIDGLEAFGGFVSHTRNVPRGFDFAGKRLGVVGTGSTSVQIVTSTIDIVAGLVLFQRTPQWIVPLLNDPVTDEQRRQYEENPELMQSEYDRLNNELNTQFAAAVIRENPEAHDALKEACYANLQTVRDPDLRRRLTPDYEVGCKRLIMSEGFYEAIQKPNARLVTERILCVERDGVRTADGELHELDVLLLATGFDPHSPYGDAMIVGRDAISLADAWRDGAVAHKQVMTAGFPNWFMIGGPGSPIGNFSFLLTAEHQVGYAMQLIDRLVESGSRSIEVKKAAQDRFEAARRERMKNTVWVSGCTTWYRDKSGNVPFWPWNYDRFKEDMRSPNIADFDFN